MMIDCCEPAELADTIVIFDEAHNIEDVSRESASLDVELDTINEMIVSLSRAVKYNMHPETYQPLLEMVTAIKAWFSQHIGNLTTVRIVHFSSFL